MTEYTAYQRAGRRRSRKESAQGDAVTAALTMQVLICVVLLLLAVFIKKTDEARYRAIKSDYSAMVTEPVDWEQAWSGLQNGGGAVQRLFTAIEEWISGLLSRFAGDPAERLPPIEEEPQDPPDSETEPAADFRFDYLGTEPVVAVAAMTPTPVSAALGSDVGQESPEGCTLSPVYLAGKIRPPVTGLITSEFSYRVHPVSGKDDFHNGMDIAAEEGREILAALPGEVAETGWSDIYGNYIILQHATNLRTFYAHCSELIAKEGMAVRQGERIAKVGQTGVVTGPHLHFSVIVEGQFTDPTWILQDNIKLVDQQ